MTALTLISYDSAAGTGDAALAEYAGGSCNGALFNSAGAIFTERQRKSAGR